MLDGEGEWLAAVVANLADDNTKLVYADWLQEHGDAARAAFLRTFAAAAGATNADDLPKPKKTFGEEWLELIGFRLLERALCEGFPELKPPLLKLARPALRMVKKSAKDATLAVGASKIGGRPDLPPGYAWPKGKECKATYNDETTGVEELAGFLAQVNLAEVAHTQAAKDLPKSGLLSFFSFQDGENDNPDVIGAKAVYFPDATGLARTDPPEPLTQGNTEMPAERLTFAETLDLPERNSGPWEGELLPGPAASEDDDDDADYDVVFDHFRTLNFDNVLGHARSTSGGDPTPSKLYRHLILLRNSQGCRLHIQISKANLAAGKFGKIKLVWVDFD
jgi:uncharacterized protein (TIGR02996 family)